MVSKWKDPRQLNWIQGWELCPLGKWKVNPMQRERQARSMLHTWTTVGWLQIESHQSIMILIFMMETGRLVQGPQSWNWQIWDVVPDTIIILITQKRDLRFITSKKLFPRRKQEEVGMGAEKLETNTCSLQGSVYSHSSPSHVLLKTPSLNIRFQIKLKTLLPFSPKGANETPINQVSSSTTRVQLDVLQSMKYRVNLTTTHPAYMPCETNKRGKRREII